MQLLHYRRFPNQTDDSSVVVGYEMHLTEDETRAWAHRDGNRWPNSMLSGRPITVIVYEHGLTDIGTTLPDPDDIPSHELEALIADHLPADLRHLWPTWHAEDARADASAAALR